jgi:hypothetical protein
MPHILKTLAIAAVLMTASSGHAVAMDQSIKHRYVIEADGEVIGTVDMRRSSRGEGYDELQVETQLSLGIGSAEGVDEVTGDSIVRIGPNGIIRFDHRWRQNDLRYRIAGEKVHGGLWVSAQHVKTPKQHEDKNFTDGAIQLMTNAVPHLGLVVSLFSEGDTSEPIPSGEFDLTEAELPQFIAAGRTGEFRVLNTEELDIDTIDLRQEGLEILLIGDSRFETQLASVTSKNTSARYWIANDSLGPFVVKVEGLDKEDAYTVRLSQHPTTP